MSHIFTYLILLLSLANTVASQTVTIDIDAGEKKRSVNPLLFGINTARWDESLFPGPADEMLLTCDRDAIAKIKASGVTLLKYPGGNDADSYIWNAPGNNAGEMDTDEYLTLCREVGAEPFITVNFNESPDLAAAWVRYCNKVRGYRVKYWEIGDEQWGWWAKGHASPEEYAVKYNAFAKAMKAADPTIKVATNVSLGPHPEHWTERVLKAAGDNIDMLTVTFFPQQWGQENDDTLFASVAKYREQFTRLRQDVELTAGREKANSIIYVNVGYNSVNHSPGPQTLRIVNALWVADMIGTMAEVGTDVACYWALHNCFPPRNGDYGYLSSEGSNTPRLNYYVFPMFARHMGRDLIASTSSDPSLSVYATKTGKKLSFSVINKNSTSARKIDVRLKNFVPQQYAHAWVLDSLRHNEPLPDPVAASGKFMIEVPAYSLVTLDLIDRDSVLPPPNLARKAEVSASSYSVIGPNFKPESAIDGKFYTRWNSAAWTKSNGAEEQWLQLSWKEPQKFSMVRIRWGETCATQYSVDVSNDARSWTTLQEISHGKGGVEECTFAPHSARHVRIHGKHGTGGRSTISAYSIREIEVYDTAARQHAIEQ